MSDIRTTRDSQDRLRSYRTQQEGKKAELVSDMSQGLDIQHHDTSLRHTFGLAFEVPTQVAGLALDDVNGFVGVSDNVAREDHRHGFAEIPWTVVGSFSNSWGNFGGSGNYNAAYRKVGDCVEIRGIVSGGTVGAFTIYTLPVGYRPVGFIRFPVVSNNAFGYGLVRATGSVELQVGSNVWAELNCRFSIL